MPDAVALDAAEERSAFSHPPVAPDATAAYGEHPDHVVDFYAPRGPRAAGGDPAPLVVAFHGGAWRAPYDREHLSPFAAFLAGHGLAVASVEYRRGGDPLPGVEGPVAGRWPDTFDDVAAALDALPGLVRGALPQADPRRTVLTGHSAGGQLALWGAARHVLPASSRWRPAAAHTLRGVVALAPVVDFELAGKLGVCGGAVEQLLGGAGGQLSRGAGEFAERRAQTDPYLLHPTGIATAVVHGRQDIVVPAAVAESYADMAAASGEPVGLTLLDDVGHFALIDPASDACAVAAEEIAQLAW